MQCRAGSGGDGGARLVVTAVRGEPSHSEPVAFTPTLGPGGVMPRYRLADATGGPARLIDGPPGGLYSALRAIDHHEHRGISGLGGQGSLPPRLQGQEGAEQGAGAGWPGWPAD